MIKHMLENHNVRNIVLESKGFEIVKSHEFAPYLFSPSDVFDEMSFQMKKLKLTDVLTYSQVFKEKLSMILGYFAETAVGPARKGLEYIVSSGKSEEEKAEYVQMLKENDLTNGYRIDNDELKQDDKFRLEFSNKPWMKPPIRLNNTIMRDSRVDFYLKKIGQLAKKHNVNLYFVYHPLYTDPLISQDLYNYYSSMGIVLLPDLDRLHNITYWRNQSHLFKKGADVFSDEISRLLKNVGASKYRKLYTGAGWESLVY